MSASFAFQWTPDEFQNEAVSAGFLGLARTAMDGVALGKVFAPEATGRLKRSVRTAPPDYEGDDTEAATEEDLAATSVEDVLAQIARDRSGGAILFGSWIDYSYHVEAGTELMGAQPYVKPAGDVLIGGERFALHVAEEWGRE
jgi:hypothetical protein